MAEITKTIVPAGLYTDPGPFSAAPEGALVEAQNVVLLREGLLEPRPGFTLQADSGVSEYDIVSHGTYVEDVGEFVWYDSGFLGWTVRRDATDTITGPTDFTHGKINAQYVKGRLLFTSDEGICEMPQESGDTIAYRAGLPRPSAPKCSIITAASSWLATDESTAYRFVLGRKRSDGSLMLSAPSCRVIAKNSPAVAGTAYVTFESSSYGSLTYNPYSVGSAFDTLEEGDFLYIYRSNKQTDASLWPDDEMRLRATLTYSSGSFEFFDDKLDDDEWSGPPLYTNSTQEGITQANIRPVYARDIALYNGMTLYGGYKSTQRVVLTLKAVEQSSAAASPQEIFGGNASFAMATTAGSVNISFASTVLPFLTVGQVLTFNSEPGAGGDTVFPANTQIVSINSGASTAVISSAALSTGPWATKVWDWIQVDDSSGSYRIYGKADAVSSISSANIFLTYGATDTSTYFIGGYQDLEYRWNNDPARLQDVLLRADGETPYKNILLVFERASLSSDPFTVTSTKPLAFDRYVDTVTGVTSSQDGNGSRLAISKTDIPDAVPLLNYIDIGNLSSDIIRVIPAQNTCLVFKEDGIYQVFGNDPSSLSVETLDLSAQPVPYSEAGNWITARGSTVFMMSKNGPLAVTDSGTVPIGAPVMETFREMFGGGFRKAVGRLSSGTSNNSPYVLFSYNELSTQDGGLSFVFNVENGTWTTWTQRRAITSHWLGEDGNLMIALGAGEEAPSSPRGISGPVYGYVNVDRGQTDTRIGFDSIEDNYLSATSTSLGDSLYDFGYTFGQPLFRPKVGDIIKDPYDSNFGVVVSADNNSFTAYILSGTFDVGPVAVEVREAYPVRVTFAPSAFGAPGIEKEILKVSYAFNQRAFLLGFSAEFETYRLNSDGEQETETLQLIPSWGAGETEAEREQTMLWAPDFISLDVPRSVASDWATKIGFSITQAGIWFSLGALVLKANVSSDLVNRGRS